MRRRRSRSVRLSLAVDGDAARNRITFVLRKQNQARPKARDVSMVSDQGNGASPMRFGLAPRVEVVPDWRSPLGPRSRT